MTLSASLQMAQRRIMLFCFGFISGLALWQLAENWDNPALSPALYLALFSFIGSYATLALALCGPVPMRRALPGALILALPFSGLISLGGLRYDLATNVLDQPILISVSLLFLLLATPFLLVGLQDRRAWRDYAALFEAAWTLTIRYLSAWVFVSLFWLMMFLSNALLELVDVEIIQWIIDIDWLVFALTGGVLGLAMAVVFELRTTVSPFLLLRLLRLLVVPVLAVVALFLAAIPLRGLSQVFGDFSAAATLMSVAMVMITLIAVVLERDDARMRDSFTISHATQALALLLPLVTGLAAWSIWLRVAEYGWTPDRVLATCTSGVLLGYGLLYALAVLRRLGWSKRIRRINVGLALVSIAISASLLTPLLNTDRISANSQVARYLDGGLPIEDLPLWQMQFEWGRSGQAAIAALENSSTGQSLELVERLQRLQSAKSRWEFSHSVQDDRLDTLKAELVELMPIRPKGQELQIEDLKGLQVNQLSPWVAGCRRNLPDGRPGCVMVIDEFAPTTSRQGVVLYSNGDGFQSVNSNHIVLDDVDFSRVNSAKVVEGERGSDLNTSAIEAILDGNYSVGPSSLRVLHVDGFEIMPNP
ncbi:hypothetical protein A9Q94_00140 [Rhodobacterales bacterium 56_14_T64]|nr:hypothetical protein A9Q94_00140 [Rhodobacterales bacterium 56_14_T64]